MSLLPARIATGTNPNVTRQAIKSYISVTGTMPGYTRNFVDENGVFQQVEQDPEFEGQMIAFKATGVSEVCDLYVVVDIGDGVLVWKSVLPKRLVIDSRTGRPWDPMAIYNNPLTLGPR